MNRPTTIALSNVSKRFGDIEAVRDVTLHIDAGEVVGFVGPNGAGKTTTIAMMMGFIRPSAGQVRVLGHTIVPETAHVVHGSIGYAAGDMALPGSLSGEQYLGFNAARNGRNQDEYKRLITQLEPILSHPIRTLSRGNKQKLALVSALQHKPKLLILDEPTAGLDPLMQEIFIDTIKRVTTHGTTVLMSSHILSEVSSLCSRIIFMKMGRLSLDQPIAQLSNQTGRVCIITSEHITPLIKYLPEGCQLLARSSREIKVAVPLTMLKPFMRWLLTKNFTDLKIEERELDDIFHDLYRTKKVRS